jgi:hypothetical protein
LDLSRCVPNCGKDVVITEIRVISKGGYIKEFYIESPESPTEPNLLRQAQ